MRIRYPIAVIGMLTAALVAGCGNGFLADLDLLPSADDISDELRADCAGVMTDDEITTALIAARLDRLNGYTKDEERATALQNCTIDALFSDVAIDDCMTCKGAILDEIYGP